MNDANLISFEKLRRASISNKESASKSDLCLRLRNEIDRLALSISELKAQADRVQRAADALGDELLLDNSDAESTIPVSNRNVRFQG